METSGSAFEGGPTKSSDEEETDRSESGEGARPRLVGRPSGLRPHRRRCFVTFAGSKGTAAAAREWLTKITEEVVAASGHLRGRRVSLLSFGVSRWLFA